MLYITVGGRVYSTHLAGLWEDVLGKVVGECLLLIHALYKDETKGVGKSERYRKE